MQEGLKKAGQKIGVVEKPRTLEDDICELCPQLTMQQRIAAFCGAMSDQSKWWVVGRNLTVILPLSLQRAAALVT